MVKDTSYYDLLVRRRRHRPPTRCTARAHCAHRRWLTRQRRTHAPRGRANEASQGQIKKAYYQRHAVPRQHAGDDAKAEEFKRLSDAYQTLFDNERRAAYDLHGKAGEQGGTWSTRDLYAATFGGLSRGRRARRAAARRAGAGRRARRGAAVGAEELSAAAAGRRGGVGRSAGRRGASA